MPERGHAQSLFDSAVSGDRISTTEQPALQQKGTVQTGIFATDDELTSVYAMGVVKCEVSANDDISAYLELRFRGASEDEENNEFTLREGYVNLRFDTIDLRIGRQIVVWGRADGINPSNNITPLDYTVISPDEDDKKLANFLVKSTYYAAPFSLEVDWVPVAKSSILPFEDVTLPTGVEWAEASNPDSNWDNGSIGLKLDLLGTAFEGSLSYYDGYAKTPGITYAGSQLYTEQFRTRIIGSDFSTSIGSFGFRGECAYSFPYKDSNQTFSIPCSELQYIVGIDRSWRNFSCIAQYIGKYVKDLETHSLSDSSLEEIAQWNRMIFSQQETWQHSVSLRPSVTLFHEEVKCELLALANLSTEETYVQPKVTYALYDAVNLICGAQLYYGPDDTLYGYMSDGRSAVFCEVQLSF
jgi:hypothetical protein